MDGSPHEGIAHGEIAYPVAWSVLDHEGGSGAAGQIEVVSRLTDVLTPGDIRAPMPNQGFTGADWIEAPAMPLRGMPLRVRFRPRFSGSDLTTRVC